MTDCLRWVENLGDSVLNVGHYSDGSVIIVDGFESVCIEEEHLDVVIDHLQKIRDSKRRD